MPKIIKNKTYSEYNLAKPKAKAYRLGDGHSLYLCILPSGKKRWQFDYSFNGKRNTYTFGYFETTSLKEAREEVRILKDNLSKGIPPKPISNADQKLTFTHIYEQWSSIQQWVDGHRKRITNFFEREILPHIGDKPVDEIRSADIMAIALKLVEEGKRNNAKDVIQRCNAVFEYAVDMDLCTKNPARNRGKTIKRDEEVKRPSLRQDQIPEFLDNLENYKGREFIKIGLFLMMLTFVRPSELRCATWGEFDLNRAVWHIPKHRMKMRRPHIVPLSTQVIEMLQQLKEVNRGSDYLFPSIHSAHKPISDVTFLKAIQIMGYTGEKKIVPHGFRHTASTILHEHEFNSLHIELQLAHIDKNKIRGTYNEADYLLQRKEMMQWYSDFIYGMKM